VRAGDPHVHIAIYFVVTGPRNTSCTSPYKMLRIFIAMTEAVSEISTVEGVVIAAVLAVFFTLIETFLAYKVQRNLTMNGGYTVLHAEPEEQPADTKRTLDLVQDKCAFSMQRQPDAQQQRLRILWPRLRSAAAHAS